MTEHIKRILPLVLVFFLCGNAMAGGLEKGFNAMAKKDYFSAEKYFNKVLFKKCTGANFGLAKLHSIERSPYFDLELSLKHVITADSSLSFELEREKEKLLELGVSKASIVSLKNEIADKAFKALKEDPTDERIDSYLKHFTFSENYLAATKIKSKRAFEQAKEADDAESYRQFVIQFPSSEERLEADSLYALRFFQKQTSSGKLDDYKLFVREFPSSQYSDQAFDTIFFYIKKKNSIDQYDDFIRFYPKNKNTTEAWKLMNRIYLKDYTESNLRNLLEVYPDNPFSADIAEELRLMYEPRFSVNDDNGWFLIDKEGKRLSKGYYESISEFNEGLARVSTNEKVGFMDKNGNIRIEPGFQDALLYHSNVCVVEKNDKFGLIDRWGEYIMRPIYDEIGNASNNQIPYLKEGRAGYYPLRAAKEIKEKFEEASDFVNGTAVVKKDGLYGAIDTLGKWTIPALYDWVEENVKGYSRVKKGELYGLAAHGSGEVLPIEYQAIGSLFEGRRLVAQDGIFGYIDASAQWVIPMKYTFDNSTLRISNFNAIGALVTENSLYGLIDKQGKYILMPKFQNLLSGAGEYIAYQEKNRWGFMDITGAKRTAEYEEAYPFIQGIALVKSGGKYGMIDHTFKYILNPEYSSIEGLKNTELCVVSQEGRYGIIHRNGGILVPLEYDKIEMVNIRYFKLIKEGRTVIYDSSSEVMVWPK